MEETTPDLAPDLAPDPVEALDRQFRDHEHKGPDSKQIDIKNVKHPGILMLVGSDTAETCTNSTNSISLKTVSSINIPITSPVFVIANYRYNYSAAAGNQNALIGVKINSTQVFSDSTANLNVGGIVDRSGTLSFWISPRSTNQLRCVLGQAYPNSSGATVTIDSDDNPCPLAAITSISLTVSLSDSRPSICLGNMLVFTI